MRKPDDFRGNRSQLICSISCNFRREIWRRYVRKLIYIGNLPVAACKFLKSVLYANINDQTALQKSPILCCVCLEEGNYT